jgi:hypothetical protein
MGWMPGIDKMIAGYTSGSAQAADRARFILLVAGATAHLRAFATPGFAQ